MSLERARLVFVGLLSLVMAATGCWMLLKGTGRHDKLWGSFGALFFGLGGLMLLHSATKDQDSLMRQPRTPTRSRPFVLPVVLLFSLPWTQKLLICLPLLVARTLLFPRYESERALHAACGFAAVIAVGQAFLAVMANHGSDPAENPWIRLPQAVFSAIVILLDLRVLWEVFRRLRPSAATENLASYRP